MKIKTDTVLVNFAGKPIQDNDGSEVTLGKLMTGGLLADSNINISASDDVKVARFKLAKRIDQAGGSVDIDSKEITDLRIVIAAAYSVMAAGQAIELLENGGVPPDQPEDT